MLSQGGNLRDGNSKEDNSRQMLLKTEFECDLTVKNDDHAIIFPEKRDYDIFIKEESMDYEEGSSQVRDHCSNYVFIIFSPNLNIIIIFLYPAEQLRCVCWWYKR